MGAGKRDLTEAVDIARSAKNEAAFRLYTCTKTRAQAPGDVLGKLREVVKSMTSGDRSGAIRWWLVFSTLRSVCTGRR